MDGFSGTLRLTDLNDFIAPTQECIKPVKIERKSGKLSAIKITSSGDYAEVDSHGVETKLVKAQITLNDCLACSGCVTSAETVLIQLQSAEELCRVLDENAKVSAAERKLVVVSVSAQAFASLANRYQLTMKECEEKFCGFLRSMGVDRVYDMGAASALALKETQREFVDRYRSGDRKSALPMLTSACPGWICYAEKTHGLFILPFISTTKSPQQIMGSLVKNHLAEHQCKSPSQIYHVTVMMCYDKKLEASRDDFYDDLYRTRDVDCVVTSLEVEQMLEQRNLVLSQCESVPLDRLPGVESSFHAVGGGAGGYLENILSFAAKELFQTEIGPIEYKVIRNQDFREVTISVNGEPKLHFAAAYGFRNIQNIVQKMKRGKCPYDFVEIMACPSACLNGGGQIRPPDPSVAKIWLQNVQQLFDSLDCQKLENVQWVQQLYDAWIGPQDDDRKRLQLLHTQYHSLENKSNALNIKW
ncbi:Cytosolic Fe-S cluster assembly factor NARFL [Hypsibius exemplaris]|uniref:Cytosolic Fe-S cluster assembly factor NARFL n=1 Tax=Hypsibius exemplaris TaxID=2072580 RepID=A0A1W0XAD1_HYPEX|nr:Cytosolic Fe-S cluster assembly factor NARFL [Hypsibius exemplaris]